MKKIFILVAIAMVSAACSSFKSGESAAKGHSDMTIALDRAVGSHAPAGESSSEVLNNQIQGQATAKVDEKGIHRIQEKLNQLGYNPGPIDGIWGPKTQQAIKKFQQDNRLPVTGKLDDDSRRQLMHIANGGQMEAKDPVEQPTYSLMTKKAKGPVEQPTYSLMTGQEARQLIERHIEEKDIHLDTNILYRKHLNKSDSESTSDMFQGVKFDDKNYLVFALCQPGYRMVKSAEDLPDKLAKLNMDLPDDPLSFTFNGIFYTTVNLEVKSNPVYSYTEPGGFINNDKIPKGGYSLLIGDSGMNLGSAFIFFHNPAKKNFLESWRAQPNVFMVKMSLSKEKGILLKFYRH